MIRGCVLPALAAAVLAVQAARADAPLPADSLYQVQATLTTQSGARAGFDLDRGHPTVVSMFYGSCPATCPMLITAIQVYEKHLAPPERSRLRVLLVSFDAARDTPRQLEHLATLHRTDRGRWTFASAAEPDARRIAAILGIRYRRLADGDFEHSAVITLLDAEGRVIARSTAPTGDESFQRALDAATRAAASDD